MHKTFCPAKWDELFINPNFNFVYSCCKGVPVKFVNKEQIETLLNDQKLNLSSGIQDSSCEYCWKLENQGHTSKRHSYLKSFTGDIDEYINKNPKAQHVEINLGNECNFQCIYCNPKFSSQWEIDVKNKQYKIYSDRYFYSIDEKTNTEIDDTIDWLRHYNNIDTLAVLGGEPLKHKSFFKLVETVPSKKLSLSTNLSCTTFDPIDRLLLIAERYENVHVSISLDCTGVLAEFTRYGLDYQRILKNIEYILEHKKDNTLIQISSLMNSLSINDLDNFIPVVFDLHRRFPQLIWFIEYCRDPAILTLNTLKDIDKPKVLENINQLKDQNWIAGADALAGAVQVSKFNKTLYAQLREFLVEFSERKKLDLPIIL